MTTHERAARRGGRVGLYIAGLAAIVAIYLIIPMMVALRPLLSYGWLSLVIAIGLVALGEVAVVRVLQRTSPQRETVTTRREREQAYSGPVAFAVEISAPSNGLRAFPSFGRAMVASQSELIVRVGSARWRNYHGYVTVRALLPGDTINARAQIVHSEEAPPVGGRPQWVLRLRLVAMSQADEERYLRAIS